VLFRSTRPELALGYGRAAINQFIDTLALQSENPLMIQRLEVLSLQDNGVLAFQITVPSRVVTTAPRFHSLRPAAPFRNAEAIYREAISNSSPYYRLLLAYRGFEGIQQIRKVIRKSAERFRVTDKMPRPVSLDATELAQIDFHGPVLNLKNSDDLVEHYRQLRNGVAHFVVEQKAGGSLQFSSTLVYTYAKVSTVLLRYLRLELRQLRDYYERHLANRIHKYPLWNPDDRGKQHLVVCPDDESTAPPDDFN